MSKPLPVILLFGPTGVGKTELCGRLFSRGYEIVSTDALQVYRGMDIGTAKPTPEERKAIPHHLVDIRNPDELFSAGDYLHEAESAVREIHSRGAIPLLSGGTAFYFHTFLYGLPDAPRADKEIRDRLLQELEVRGLNELYRELHKMDPARAEVLHPNDRTRILRALEIYRQSGQPASSFSGSRKLRQDCSLLILGLQRERSELYQRINKRVELMFSMGLSDEVRLLKAHGYGPDDPGMKGIGYREFFTHPREQEHEIREEIQKNSRRYAKRQITFFSSLPHVIWFHPEETAGMKRRIESFLESR